MLNICGYAMAHGMDFSLYGENAILSFQSLIIIAQMWYYRKDVSLRHKIITIVIASIYMTMVLGGVSLSEPVWNSIIFFNSIGNAVSIFPQLYENWKNKSTGELSLTTFMINWVNSIFRMGTVIYENPRPMFILQESSEVFVTTSIMYQFRKYWKNGRGAGGDEMGGQAEG